MLNKVQIISLTSLAALALSAGMTTQSYASTPQIKETASVFKSQMTPQSKPVYTQTAQVRSFNRGARNRGVRSRGFNRGFRSGNFNRGVQNRGFNRGVQSRSFNGGFNRGFNRGFVGRRGFNNLSLIHI